MIRFFFFFGYKGKKWQDSKKTNSIKVKKKNKTTQKFDISLKKLIIIYRLE